MTHEHAYALVSEICPEQSGLLWNTTFHHGCDTSWAVADQYDDDEVEQARQALQKLAAGEIPDEWEPFTMTTNEAADGSR